MSFQRLQLHFDLVPPSFIIVGVCLQRQSSRFVIEGTIRWQLILWWWFYVLSKRYSKNNETMKYDDAWWVICSGGVGGSIGVGWVLLRQPECRQRAYEIYATIIDMSCGVIIERVGACIQSFNKNCNIQLFRCMLDRLWGAIGVFVMFIYRVGGGNQFLSVEGCMSYWNKTCCGFVSRGIVLQLLGGMPLQ